MITSITSTKKGSRHLSLVPPLSSTESTIPEGSQKGFPEGQKRKIPNRPWTKFCQVERSDRLSRIERIR